MKKQTLITIGLIIVAVFLLGVWYGKTQAKIIQQTEITAPSPDYLHLNDYDTIIKPKTSFYAYETRQKEVTAELKEFLVNEEYYSFRDTNSCMKDGNVCTADNSDIKMEEVDLGVDGTKEYIVLPWKVCDCMVRGASANGDILIVKAGSTGFEIIGHLQGNGFVISEDTTNGYHDIITNDHNSAGSGTESIYKFQSFYGDATKGSYEKYLSKVYDFSRVGKQ